MVERMVNRQNLAPPKQDDNHSPHGNLFGKSSSPNNSVFKRTLPKRLLGMAVRIIVNASSELRVNNSGMCLDGGGVDDYIAGMESPVDMQAR
ncbi:Basic Proline-rich Protein 1 [Hibiscus trionum]|uniref:Basic Proline-rich Protein 1 n=1 Tax=Hibiscus trionum TaxID=183268 RepID=A0A9W7HPQ9_HIBTR|nr:Basic Proline-rich Protein 1 [Hibiscus trionum]